MRNQAVHEQIFTPLSRTEARHWAQRFPPGPRRAGEILFYSGHEPYGLYILGSGLVEFQTPGLWTESRSLQFEAPALIGLRNSLYQQVYRVNCRICRDSSVGFVSRQNLLQLFRDRERLILDLFSNISKAWW